MASLQRIAANLWFDDEAEEAATFYTCIFKNSRITKVAHYGKEGQEIHKRPPGSVMTVEFELDGQKFLGLNGGPVFKFNEAISFIVYCKNQKEIDYYWQKLNEGGDPKAQQCGWLKDKFGVSWQIVPTVMSEMMSNQDEKRRDRVMHEMLKMKKLDIEKLEEAYGGMVNA